MSVTAFTYGHLKLYSLYTAVFLHADYDAVKFRDCSVKYVKKKDVLKFYAVLKGFILENRERNDI